MNKDLLAKRKAEAAAKMFPPSDAERIAQLEAENRELKGRLLIAEMQLFNTTTVARDLLEQKDAEIAKLYAEVQRMADNSPFQYFPQVVWSKS